jgi:hypothetical protein
VLYRGIRGKRKGFVFGKALFPVLVEAMHRDGIPKDYRLLFHYCRYEIPTDHRIDEMAAQRERPPEAALFSWELVIE